MLMNTNEELLLNSTKSVDNDDAHQQGAYSGLVSVDKDDSFTQLWHACAGHRVYVPRAGDLVFYIPQEHLEQVKAYTKEEESMDMPMYSLPSRVLCKVFQVQLEAEAQTNEIFARVTLIPEAKQEWQTAFPLISHRITRANYFKKVLTKSDTNQNGELSLPKRLAVQCFPPLDVSQQPPEQELIAKDLHGVEWHFIHTCRGKSKRHLLTAGWTDFVTSKKLLVGDSCIFLRGKDGKINVGIRRASLQCDSSTSVIFGQNMQHGILTSAFLAISTGTIFTVYNRPWTTTNQFLFLYDYVKSIDNDWSVGTSFQQRFTGEDSLDCKSILLPAKRTLNSDSFSPGLSVSVKDDLFQGSLACTPKTVLQGQENRAGDAHESIAFISLPSNHLSIPDQGFETGLKYQSKFSRHDQCSVYDGGTLSLLSPFGPQDMNMSEQKSETQDPLPQQIGGGKYMLFGVNLVNYSMEHPSAQTATSLELRSHSILPTTAQSSSETVNLSVSSMSFARTALFARNVNTDRNRIKVFKYQTAVGRAVELTLFDGYDELIRFLDQLFDLKGELIDRSCGWCVTYKDDEGDMMLIGDYPWQKFRSTVQRMFIYPKIHINELNVISSKHTTTQ